ncbi:MAG: alpha-galactosidase [Caulobacteraceae bacterium]|nr:alpha-galactosidase [Caulobacter sp.]
MSEARVTASADGRTFRLDGGGMTYALGVDAHGYLQPLYWGPSLSAGDPLEARAFKEVTGFDPAGLVTPQEFPGQGEGLVTEPGLKAAFEDGVRDVVLKFRHAEVSGETLTVELADIERPLSVTLRYTMYPDTGVVARQATVRNGGAAPVRLDQFLAAVFTLPPAPDWRLRYLSGRYASEFQAREQPVTPVAAVLESRRGSTSHHMNPWFALERAGTTTEEQGPVWFGALAWSGSWRITVGEDQFGRVQVSGGFNPYDFSWSLRPGETLESPVFYAGYSGDGRGGASRLLHRFELAHVLPQAPAPKPRPVLYNSWEATAFDVTEAGQAKLAEQAARIGVERFVMDDGWFGARDTDKAGLGDWTVNRRKFPHGLKPLIDKVHGLGMSFGLWVEPEMVNPDSDLYRAHPDWVLNWPGRPRTQARNQLVLNLARTDVRDHLLKVLDDLLNENDIQFLKWDYNRNWTEPGWPQVAPADQQRLYVDYVRNLYALLAELRRRHPGLEIETCSGGGGRIDLGILHETDQAWISDNTDPFDRLAIQDGFTEAYTPAVMMAWVTDSPNWANNRSTSLDYRFLSSMQGSLGIGANLNHWSEADFARARAWVAAYKTVRDTVQTGDLYRLERPAAGAERTAVLYVGRDRRQAVVFALLHSSQRSDEPPPLRLRGLDPERRYRLRPLGPTAALEGEPAQASGAYWMREGLRVKLVGDFQGGAYVLEAVS